MEKKRRLKEMFDSEYDDKGDDYFDSLKAEMSQQAQVGDIQYSVTIPIAISMMQYCIWKVLLLRNSCGFE